MKTTIVIIMLSALSFMEFKPILSKQTQLLTPKEIVDKAYYNERSNAYSLDMSIKVVRPNWSRELFSRTWAMGSAYGLMLITNPAKEKGVSFLRIKSEGWNWLPNIERVVKISPSQMSQSWMGSDFSNEDLLKEASIVNDYDHKLLSEEIYGNTNCYKIQATPKAGAAVIWGKKIIWIGKEDFLERKTENYDEDGTLISTLIKTEIKEIGGKKIPTTLTMTPKNKKGNSTVVTISGGNFKATVNESFFTQENMKKVK